MPRLRRRVFSLDTECTGLDTRHGALPFFITMCDVEHNVYYWQADVDPISRLPLWEQEDLDEAEEMIRSADELVLQNPKFDMHALDGLDIHLANLWPKISDTLTAGHLLASNQPHDLTTMCMIYLRLNVKPLEDALQDATIQARKIVGKEFPEWRIAKAGMPDMPSFKPSKQKNARGEVKDEGKKWKFDSWLPKAVALEKGYPKDHEWWTVLEDYGNGDSSVTLPLWIKLKELLEQQDLFPIYEERILLLRELYDMEVQGMTMSKSRTVERRRTITSEAEECRVECLELADHEIEDLPVNGVSNALRYVVFEKFALKSTKKSKKTGKPSMDKHVLDHWLATLPEKSKPYRFVNNLRKYRKRKTALGYMDSYERFWIPVKGSDGADTMVVFPSYNPTGADTLRGACSNPNQQQVSKQEEANTRYCFGPPPGWEWWSIDFSNLELRIPAYEANESDMVFLFEHPDDPPYYGSYHMMIFDTLHPKMFAKHGMECKNLFESTWYQWTKNGNFAVQYGAVEKSGTADKAYHVEGAQHRIASRFLQIKKLSDHWINYAKKYGYVETMPDKTLDTDRGYPLYCTRTKWGSVLETVPLSYHVQGTAMWMTMKALKRCGSYLRKHPESRGRTICQVHDEAIFAFPLGKGVKHVPKLQELMQEGGNDIGVPLRTSVKYHPNNWDKSEKYKVAS